MKILFTNAGRRTYLVENALRLREVYDLEIYVSDTSKATAAMWVAPEVERFITPRVESSPEAYVAALLTRCIEAGIELVVPLMDYELPVLARWKEEFAAEGIAVVVSSSVVIDRTLDKRQCYAHCSASGLRVPRTWYEGDAIDEAKPPLVLKRVRGSGSVGLQRIEPGERVPTAVPPGFLLQQAVAGDEYGMDVLNSLGGDYEHCCVRKKLAMRAGETDKAAVVYDDLFRDLGQQVSEAFQHVGNMDVDFISTVEGEIFFIDFNPRFGGGYPFTLAAGFDYLRALIAWHHGDKVILPAVGRRIVGAKGLQLFAFEEDI